MQTFDALRMNAQVFKHSQNNIQCKLIKQLNVHVPRVNTICSLCIHLYGLPKR
eukprot:c28496_g1_i1 orf=53-211(+)